MADAYINVILDDQRIKQLQEIGLAETIDKQIGTPFCDVEDGLAAQLAYRHRPDRLAGAGAPGACRDTGFSLA